MSRFFAQETDSESEDDMHENEVQQRPAVATKAFVWSDDEDEPARIVRSAKDKRFDDMRTIIKKLKNHKKIKDMAKVLQDFEDLKKAFDKSKKVVEQEGVPRFFVRTISDLEEFINELWEDKEARKSMSKNNARGLTSLRQKIRKYNKDYFENDINAYRENPDDGDGDDLSIDLSGSEGGDSEDDVDNAPNPFLKNDKSETPERSSDFLKDSKDGGDDDDDDDSDDFSYGSDSDSGSSIDQDAMKGGTGNLADLFLKKTDGSKEKKEKTSKDKDDEKKLRKKKRLEDESEWQDVKGGAVIQMDKPKMFAKDTEVNLDAVCKKLREIESARGRKGTDRNQQIELLIELREIAQINKLGNAVDTKMLFSIIGAIYDYKSNIASCMKLEMWDKCIAYLEEMLENLIKYPEIQVGENISEDSEKLDGDAPFRVRGCVLTLIEKMDEEYTKMLQACDAHSTEFVERLKTETVVCRIIDKLVAYLDPSGTSEEVCRAYLKRIEHTYYKFDREHKTTDSGPNSSKSLMDKLCKYIYGKDITDRIRTRAILYHVYHHSLHDRYYEARDLQLMSHLQDTIGHSDIPTQISYNRAMVQLGICAFRQGMIRDAHNCLVDIQSLGRAKELLAQGLLLQRQHERTPEQEKIEKRRQIPYHMHINLELLECVYLVSAMLLEIPYMAAHEFDARRRLISKNFHHVMRLSERNALVGPPESMREHVVAASKAMMNGNWRACRDYIINSKMNAKVWSLFYDTDRVRNMIVQKIQEESLRTYLFSYSAIYDSLSLITLGEMFELDVPTVNSIISKMIINEDLMASLDEPSATVIMHKTEPTRLQALALQLADKVGALVENNERAMEMKSGTFNFTNRGQPFQRDNYNNYNQNQGGRGGFQNNRFNNQNRGGFKGGRGGFQGNQNRNTNYGGNRNTNYGGNRNYQDNYSSRGGKDSNAGTNAWK